MNKDLKIIDLHSQLIEGLQELTIPQGTVANYDAASGPIVVDKLINHGTIRISSTKDEINEISISARTTVCDGEIVCDLPKLTIVSTEVDARGGKFSASDRIVLSSESDLTLRGGTFESEWLDFITPGALKVHADRIEGQVSTEADSVSFGVAAGNLTVVRSKIAGDPIWYNRAGDVTISPGPTNGDDLYVAATGNITIGPINTIGGDASKPGRVQLVAGCVSINGDGSQPPQDSLVMVSCSDCDSIYQQLGIVPGFNGDLTVNGNINAKGRLDATGQNITITGNIVGAVSGIFSFRNDLKITGTVKLTNPDGSKGAIACFGENDSSQAQNVTIGGNIDADVEIFTYGQGAVKIANVSGAKDFTIFAGATVDSLPGCGGGGAVVSQSGVSPRVLPIATIQTGNLSNFQSSVTLIASGNISAGTINLLQFSPGPSLAYRSHSVAIYANLGGGTSAPVFNVGTGGVNGCGVITNKGISNPFFGGAIAIGNPGGITVTTADIKANSDTMSSPGIMLDAGQSELKLDAGLNANGNASARAGFIVLNGGKLTVPGAVTISANDTTTGSSVPAPFIVIGISDIPVPGNLNVQCNSDQGTAVQIGPTGFVTIDWLNFNYKPCKFDQNATGPVAFTGAGNIVIAAKSKNGFVNILGTPLTFNAGTVNVQATGQQGSISIAYDGQTAQQPSLISTGGKVTLNGDNSTTNAGNISVSADAINITSAFSIHANALASGIGGTISIATNGGDLSAKGGAGSFAIEAKGMGSSMMGGIVNLSSSAAITANGGAVDVTPGDGKGGTITALAATTITINGMLNADGQGSGDGGTISLDGLALVVRGVLSASSAATSGNGGSITLNSKGSTALRLSSNIFADGGANSGTGGTIQITSNSPIVIDGAVIDASSSSDGTGSVTITAATKSISLATAGSSVSGGTVRLESPKITNAGSIKAVLQLSLIENTASVFNVTNTGSISTRKSGSVARGSILIRSDQSDLPRLVKFSGTGSFDANGISINSAGNVEFLGSASYFFQVDPGAETIISTGPAGNLFVDSNSLVRVQGTGNNPDGTVSLHIIATVVSSAGTLSTSGILNFGTPPRMSVLGGILEAGAIIFNTGAGSTAGVNVEVQSINPFVSGLNVEVSGTATNGPWTVVVDTGDLQLGQVSCRKSLLAEVKAGKLIAGGDLTASAGSVTLKADVAATSASVQANSGVTISAHGGSVNFIINSLTMEPGIPNPNVTVNGPAANVFWGNQGIDYQGTQQSTINVGSAQSVVFFENEQSNKPILLIGPVTINALN